MIPWKIQTYITLLKLRCSKIQKPNISPPQHSALNMLNAQANFHQLKIQRVESIRLFLTYITLDKFLQAKVSIRFGSFSS